MGRLGAQEKQEAILSFIKREVTRRGYPPSVREIGDAIGITSTSTVHSHLSRLEKRGLIRRDPTKPRAIEITDDSYRRSDAPLVPLLGKVTAGAPITAVEDIEGYVPLPPGMNRGGDLFALRVAGDSMIEAGILHGDIVYVERTPHADNGAIVVAMTDDGEATVKRYFRERDHIRLQPENPAMQPLRLKRASILGRVVGLWRALP